MLCQNIQALVLLTYTDFFTMKNHLGFQTKKVCKKKSPNLYIIQKPKDIWYKIMLGNLSDKTSSS
jgi:hypothetical protein